MSTARSELRRLLGASAAVLALGLGLAACGGDDGDEAAPEATATTTPEMVALTTQELIDEGDSICREVNAAIGSIEASAADESTKSSQITDIYDGLAERLGELGTPSDGEAPDDVIAAARELAAGAGDATEFQEAATAYGFEDCGEGPVATSYPDSTGTVTVPGEVESTESYVPPPVESVPEAPPPVTTPPADTGGGVAPSAPDTGGGSTPGGGSSTGAGSGGIGPG